MSQFSGESRLWAKCCGRVLLVIGILSGRTFPANADESNPLRCDLVREAHLIRCEVLANKVAVSDAAINGGKCRSPWLVYQYNLRMLQQMTGSDVAGSGDFRREYEKGQTFSLYVDKECTVYKYDVTVNGKVWPFKLN